MSFAVLREVQLFLLAIFSKFKSFSLISIFLLLEGVSIHSNSDQCTIRTSFGGHTQALLDWMILEECVTRALGFVL